LPISTLSTVTLRLRTHIVLRHPKLLIPPAPLFPYTTLFRSAMSARNIPVVRRRRHAGASGPRRGVLRPRHAHDDSAADHFPGHEIGEHTSELQSRLDLVCRLLLEKKDLLITAFSYVPVSSII